jgi:hypothetical protein
MLLVQTGSEEVAITFEQTVQQNYEGYTKKQVLEANEARCTLGMIGNPSKCNFKDILRGNLISNCPVTTDAVTNAHTIFGLDPAGWGNGAANASGSSSGLCVSAKVDNQEEQDGDAGRRCFFDKTAFLLTTLH